MPPFGRFLIPSLSLLDSCPLSALYIKLAASCKIFKVAIYSFPVPVTDDKVLKVSDADQHCNAKVLVRPSKP